MSLPSPPRRRRPGWTARICRPLSRIADLAREPFNLGERLGKPVRKVRCASNALACVLVRARRVKVALLAERSMFLGTFPPCDACLIARTKYEEIKLS
jgi:hypothetical protein